MNTPEVLSEAVRLADIAEQNPEKLKDELVASQATVEELNELSRVILDERNITVDENIREAIRARYESLAEHQTETSLANLDSRFHLFELLGMRAERPADNSLFARFIAQPLRVLAESTKEIPVLGAITGIFKDFTGRDIKRGFFQVLSLFEKTPGNIIGVFGLGTILPNMNFGNFATRTVAAMDIEDVIAEEQLQGEVISFTGITYEQMNRYTAAIAQKTSADQPVLSIRELVKNYITLHREKSPGAEIEITLDKIQKPEDLQTAIDTRNTENRMATTVEQWRAQNVERVTFGEPVSAEKLTNGQWSITIPEGDATPATRTLQEALTVIPAAQTIRILPSEQRLTIDPQNNSIEIPEGITLDPALNKALELDHSRLRKIVFDTTELPITTLQARLDMVNGNLLLGANSERMYGLEMLKGAGAILDAAHDGDILEFKNGSWISLTSHQ